MVQLTEKAAVSLIHDVSNIKPLVLRKNKLECFALSSIFSLAKYFGLMTDEYHALPISREPLLKGKAQYS
jgi:hypothetical protein